MVKDNISIYNTATEFIEFIHQYIVFSIIQFLILAISEILILMKIKTPIDLLNPVGHQYIFLYSKYNRTRIQ